MLFYVDNVEGTLYELSKEESAHLRVLRSETGDIITLVDGRGNMYKAVIINAKAKCYQTEIIEHQQQYGKRQYRLHIGIAPTKNIDRFEWFVEKATEIGIDEITPLLCERSERKHINTERIKRVMVAAIKQSQKAYLPIINEMITFTKWVQNLPDDNRYIAHCNHAVSQTIKGLYQYNQDVIIAIGPEGDFSLEEVQTAINSGFSEISLGTSRLRTETAGVVACSNIAFLNQ
jgi:16S rRNA (uracil1498-N3)-methyltransferase